MYYVSYTDHIEDRVHIQIHHYEINQCVGKKKKFFVSSVSYTCTAFIRFPLSKRDSNITVVSSESRIVTAAGRQPSLFPPIRDRINYFFIYKKTTRMKYNTYITTSFRTIIINNSTIILIITTNKWCMISS